MQKQLYYLPLKQYKTILLHTSKTIPKRFYYIPLKQYQKPFYLHNSKTIPKPFYYIQVCNKIDLVLF
jgi:hypothetical protein